MQIIYFLTGILAVMMTMRSCEAAYINPLGCYKDSSNRDLKTEKRSRTLDECFTFCIKSNFTYMAMQTGKTCFCDNSYGKYGPYEDKKCNKGCMKNKKQNCGGSYANNIFELNFIQQAYMGCYPAPPADFETTNHTSVSHCIHECKVKKAFFAYLKNGAECFCHNHLPFSHASLKNCDVMCDDNNPCGGPEHYSVYQTGISLEVAMIARGCFKFMETMAQYDITDPLRCVEKCLQNNYRYAMIGHKCFCSYFYGSQGPGRRCKDVCNKKKCKTFKEVKTYEGCHTYNDNVTTCEVPTFHCKDHHYPHITSVCKGCSLGWKGPFCSMRNCQENNGDCGIHMCQMFKQGRTELTECVCKEGYIKKFHWDLCVDLNECSTFENICEKSDCVNTAGSYYCVCKPGKFDKDVCIDFDECEQNMANCDPISTTCINTDGSFECVCNYPYKCNSCKKNARHCLIGANCHKVQGELRCDCLDGLVWANGTCIDIDECHMNTSKCDLRVSDCVNTEGAFRCVCFEHFVCSVHNCSANESLACESVGECQAHDVYYLPPYICECSDGFYFDEGVCRKVDWCEEGLDVCDLKISICFSYDDTYECMCSEGYTNNHSRQCQDINECEIGLCDMNCLNTIGSYLCMCSAGYYLVNGTCEDLNECDHNTDLCDPDASTCSNLDGSYECFCSSGYYNVDNFTCGRAQTEVHFMKEGQSQKYLYLLAIPSSLFFACLMLTFSRLVKKINHDTTSRMPSTISSRQIDYRKALERPIQVRKILGEKAKRRNLISTKSFRTRNELEGTTEILKNRRKESLYKFKPILNDIEEDLYLKRNFKGVFDYIDPTRGIQPGITEEDIMTKFQTNTQGAKKVGKKKMAPKKQVKPPAINDDVKVFLEENKRHRNDYRKLNVALKAKMPEKSKVVTHNRPRRK